MADQRVTGNLILIGASGGTVALGSQPSGGGFTYLLPTSIPQVGQNLVVSSVYNGNTANLQWGSASGVTSVTITTPSILTVSGSPILAAMPWSSVTAYTAGQVVNFAGVSYVALQNNTNQEPDISPAYWAITTSGIVNLALASQSANLVFASPNGSSGVPTFRALVATDVPALSAISGSLNPSQIAQDGATTNQALAWNGSAWAPTTLVTSFNGRTGTVTAQAGDYTYSQISSTPQLPVQPVVPSHNWLNGYNSTTGVFSYSQPASTDLSDSSALARLASPTFTGTVTLPAVSVTGALTYTTANPTFFSSTGSGSVVLGTSPTISSATLAGTTSVTNVHIMGTLADGTNSVGTSGQVLTSTVTGVQWITGAFPNTFTPVTHEYLTGYNSGTETFSAARPSAADLSNGTTGTGVVVLASGPAFTGTVSAVNLSLTGTLADSTSSVGSNGQVLTSTVTGVLWATPTSSPNTFSPVTHEFLTGYNSGTLNFSAAQPSASDLTNGTTGSGAVVLATSPTIASATLSGTITVSGTATYTTVNPTFFSSTGSGAVVLATSPSIANATLSGSITISGTVTYTAANPTFFSSTGTGAVVLAVGPSFTGTATMANISITGTLKDGTSSVGTSGQVLTSTVSGTLWSTPTVAFSNITSGTNSTATMTVGTGASLTFSGTGVINANEIYGVVISSTPPSAGQVLTATSSSAAQWSTSSSVVNNGTAGQLTWYATTGTVVSGNANATISSGTLTLGVAGTTAGQLVLSSTASGTYVTVAVSSSMFTPWTFTLPMDSGTSGYVLETDGAGNTSWVPQTGGGGGGGSVTAFSAGNFSPLFTTSVSNPTTTPALSFTAINQSANTVYAGPTSGGSTAPTFRALVDADLPGGVTGTGAVVLANAPTFTANPTFASSTGSGAVVLATSPTLATPVLGAASATSLTTTTFVSVGSTITSYNGISTVGNGIATIYAQANRTAQSANVSATTLYAVPSGGAGIYRLHVWEIVSTAATSSSTLPDTEVIFTDQDSGATITIPLTTGQTGNTTSTFVTATIDINAKASTNIQYAIGQNMAYASSGATSMLFAYRARLEYLG
jgi:hypothetical protein